MAMCVGGGGGRKGEGEGGGVSREDGQRLSAAVHFEVDSSCHFNYQTIIIICPEVYINFSEANLEQTFMSDTTMVRDCIRVH